MQGIESALQTSLRDLVQVLFRRKWSFLTILVTAVLSAFVYRFVIKSDAYQTEAKLLVKLGQEQAPPPTIVAERPMILDLRQEDVNSEIDILLSTDLFGQVVDQLRLDRPLPAAPVPEGWVARGRYYARRLANDVKQWSKETLIRLGFRERLSPREEALLTLREGLHVEPREDSNVLAVWLTVPQRVGSAVILNKLLDTYSRFRVGLFNDPSAVDFFTDQVEETRARLAEVEKEIEQLEKRERIRDFDDQIRALIDQITVARDKLVDAEADYLRAAAKVERFQAQLTRAEPDFALAGGFDQRSFPETLLEQLTELEVARLQLKLSESESGPLVKSNREQFDRLMKLTQSSLSSILEEKQAAHEIRKGELARLQQELDDLHASQFRWKQLSRQATLLEDAYKMFDKKLQDAATVAAIERRRIGNVAVIQRATDPLVPVGLRKSYFLGIATLCGLFAALGWVALLEFFDHRIYSSETLRDRLGAPVVAVVPRDRRVRLRAPARPALSR